jgi:type II secretory pathway component GspD/PulD (secretin)
MDLTTSGVTYEVPIIDKRTASTKVVVGNGQTLIIGGLIKNRSIDSVFKVPFVGDLPLLGNLFRSKHKYNEKVELLFLVSPTIINPDEFVRMARKEKYGVGKEYLQDREEENKRILKAAKKDEEKKTQLSSELEALLNRQKSLFGDSKNLEQAIQQEEKNLMELETSRNLILEQRKGLTKK